LPYSYQKPPISKYDMNFKFRKLKILNAITQFDKHSSKAKTKLNTLMIIPKICTQSQQGGGILLTIDKYRKQKSNQVKVSGNYSSTANTKM